MVEGTQHRGRRGAKRRAGDRVCGTAVQYRRGCRCRACTTAASEYTKAYKKRVREEMKKKPAVQIEVKAGVEEMIRWEKQRYKMGELAQVFAWAPWRVMEREAWYMVLEASLTEHTVRELGMALWAMRRRWKKWGEEPKPKARVSPSRPLKAVV